MQETGIPALDNILNGGIPQGHVVLLSGDSGTGKTILSMEWLFKGSNTYDEPGLYLTLTEPITQAAENVQQLSFYDESAFNDGVHFTDLRTTLSLLELQDDVDKEDLEEILSAIEELVEEVGAKRLVLDSITALAYLIKEKDLIRYFIFRLGAILDNLDCTTILTSEVSDEHYSVYGVEEFISDAIIQLKQTPVSDDLRRTLQVIKMRGADYDSETFTFDITTDGIQLYDVGTTMSYPASEERISTGVPGIDEMCDGGVFASSVSMVVGPAGTGKTLTSFHFIEEGLKNGENCLYVGFEESQDQLLRNAKHFGKDFESAVDDGSLTILTEYPENKFPNQHIHDLRNIVKEKDITRVAVDPVSAIGNTYTTDEYERFTRKLVSCLKQHGASAVVTISTKNLMETNQLSQSNLSTLTDNILLLKYAETEGSLSRVLSVLKTRGTNHDNRLRQYDITEHGMEIGEPVYAFEGVFSGTTRKVRQTVREQLEGLFVEELGPIGEQEFEELENRGLTQKNVEQYIRELVDEDILAGSDAEQLRRAVDRLFEGETATVPAQHAEEESSTDEKDANRWFERLF